MGEKQTKKKKKNGRPKSKHVNNYIKINGRKTIRKEIAGLESKNKTQL